MTNAPRPLILIILDGFGYRKTTEANAIAAAHKPTWDRLLKEYPHTLIAGSGQCVGLPDGQMGNSEVGHLNMGAGRIVHQDFTRIDAAIQHGDFFQNKAFCEALSLAKKTNKAVHIMGLLSPGGVHSHEKHIGALVELAASMELSNVYLHAFLDGRDTPPQSAIASLQALDALCQAKKCGQIASIIGRYYAMDRDKRWERVEKAYDLLTQGLAAYQATSAEAGLTMAYERGENDEFVQATAIHPANSAPVTINDGDVIIFMNFRSDRAREITSCFIDPNFTGFKRKKFPKLGSFVSLCQYDKTFAIPVAFPPEPLQNIFGEYISQLGLHQLRIAETEKYAHVTFFFNGGVEAPYPLEDRVLIPSPKVATYDLKPEMSAPELTDRLIKEIQNGGYDVIICNYANADMVGHSGHFEATVKAIETIDQCLEKIIFAAKKAGGEVLITADHGNAEQMFDYETNQPHTAHTSDPVPFIYIGRPANICLENGKLSDIAPTMLYLLNLPKPAEMTGKTLLQLE